MVGAGIVCENGLRATRWGDDNHCGAATFPRPGAQILASIPGAMPTSEWEEETYVASSLKGKRLLGVGPNITIARKVGPQVVQRLPCKHNGAILWAVQERPVHRLSFADYLGRGEEVFDDGFGRHHMHQRVAIARHEMHMGQLLIVTNPWSANDSRDHD